MNDVAGKPALLKKMNLSLIYRSLIQLGTATRAEITAHTAISTTTVRSLLDELLRTGDLVELDLDVSSGGRRAQRYALNPRRNLAMCLYFEETRILYQVSNLSGEALSAGSEPIQGDPFPAILHFLEQAVRVWEIRALGLGVPGIVENKRYYVGDAAHHMVNYDIGEQVEQRLKLPVVLENDLNCIALGFALRYAKTLPEAGIDDVNMAYIHLNRACCGAGIISGGKVVHGAKQFAGEIGFLPLEQGRTLDQILAAGTPEQAMDAAARTVAAISCVTNPSLVVLGGERCDAGEIHINEVWERANSYLPAIQRPKIIACTNYREDYLSGLTYLTVQSLLPLLPLEEIR